MTDSCPRRSVSRAAVITARAGHLFTGLCLLLFTGSLHRYALYRYQPEPSGNPFSPRPVWRPTSAALGIGGGAVRVIRWYGPAADSNLIGWFAGQYAGPIVWWPQGFDHPHHFRAYPLWMLALAGYAPRGLILARDTLRAGRGHCRVCAYNLRGLPPAADGRVTCPECGDRRDAPSVAAHRSTLPPCSPAPKSGTP